MVYALFFWFVAKALKKGVLNAASLSLLDGLHHGWMINGQLLNTLAGSSKFIIVFLIANLRWSGVNLENWEEQILQIFHISIIIETYQKKLGSILPFDCFHWNEFELYLHTHISQNTKRIKKY